MTEPTAALILGLPTCDQATAAHELGHAFTARETGLTPVRLRVHRWLGGGVCYVEDDPMIDDETFIHARGVIWAAGKEAERIWRGEVELSNPWSWGAGDDYNGLRAVAEFEGQPLSAYVDEANEILMRVWDELVPLIEPLARGGYLPGIDG